MLEIKWEFCSMKIFHEVKSEWTVSSILKQQGHSYWTKLEYDVMTVIHMLADRRIWYFGMSCRTRCQRSVNRADLCDLKKRVKHYWWLWRALFLHILHALLVILLKLRFAVGYRSLSMFGVWMWAHSCNSFLLSFLLLSALYM